MADKRGSFSYEVQIHNIGIYGCYESLCVTWVSFDFKQQSYQQLL